MCICRLISIFCLLLPPCSLAQTPPPTQPAPSPAQALLQASLAKIGQMQSLEVKFQFTTYFANGFPVEQQGRCLTAPGNKVRMEMQAIQGGLKTTLHILCDGQTHRRWIELDSKKSGQLFTLADRQAALDQVQWDALGTERARHIKLELANELGTAGLLPPLQELPEKMDFEPTVREMTLRLPDRGSVPVQVINGTWNKKVLEKIAPPKAAHAPKEAPDNAELWAKRLNGLNYPRRCTVVVEKATSLPVRVEWLGPQQRGGEDVLLMRQDYLSWKTISATEAEPLFTWKSTEHAGIEWKTLTTSDLRQQYDLRRDIMLLQVKRLEEELARWREDVEKDAGKP